ncbi:MAG: VIT1/CCC1 transporter family protein [Actinomycetota bacterium]|nr:VIT1/CCC1 transporter family protein [Actinomycetota bacterium]
MAGTLLARMVGRGARRAPSPDPSGGVDGLPDHHHRDVRGGGLRAAVFGVSDGLVSNVSLVLGTAGAHPGAGIIRLAGLAGLFGGAFSMAVGEYVSMRAQREAFERELSIEREELRRRPEFERRELARIYERRGIEREVAAQLAAELMADPDVALETHAREELGIDPDELGAPLQAAGSSFITFALGALVPLLPFLLGAKGMVAVGITIGLSALAALAVGSLLSVLTARSWWRSALRQLVLCALAGAATFGIGSAIGVAG